MSLTGISTKPNIVAIIVREGGGIEILSNGKTIHPAGGPDNNPLGKFISDLGGSLAQTEEITDPAVKEAFRSALSGQVDQVMSLQTPGSNHNVLTCQQMQKRVDALRAMAEKTADPRERGMLLDSVRTQQSVVDHYCHHEFNA